MSEQRTNVDQTLMEKIRRETQTVKCEREVVNAVVDVLVQEGLDLRKEPSLEEMKCLLVEAFRSAKQSVTHQTEVVAAP